ncbi:hypothetical protein PCK2_000385 [Pneumocystis canis]|nr:hypothetical protein PCK2_000385 [Pneumocystis canis]
MPYDQDQILSDKFTCPVCFQCLVRQEKDLNTHAAVCSNKINQELNLDPHINDKNAIITLKAKRLDQTNRMDSFINTFRKKANRKFTTKIFKNQDIHKKVPHKICQFYKIMPHMGFSVDAFEFGKVEGCIGYFLSHFHSDHYKGLTSSWNNGLIYCSKITRNLVINQLKVNSEYVINLPMNEKTLLNNVWVTLIDANHCPGSVIFVFETIKSGKNLKYLHSGDFRASSFQILHPAIKNKHFDLLYLDTTYFDPKYLFPSQETVINAVIELCRILTKNTINNDFSNKKCYNLDKFLIKTNTIHQNKCRLLIVVGTYIIGKEKLALEIACSLKSKIYANQYKQKIISCLENEKLSSLLTA